MRVVCLDDDARDAELIHRELARTHAIAEWRAVSTPDQFMTALEPPYPDLILSDFRLRGFDGLDALALAKVTCPDVPFIIVSGVLGEETAADTIKLGATDYVLKDRLARLAPSVTRALAECSARAAQRRAELSLATHDRLLNAIIHAIPDPIYAIDRSGTLTIANEAFAAIMGQATEALLGTPVAGLASAAMASALARENDAVMESKVPLLAREARSPFRTADSRRYLTSKLPLIDAENGLVRGLVAISRDVTEYRVLEGRLLDAIESEQRRIGSDIHDGLGQELAGLGLMIHGLQRRLAKANSEAAEDAAEIGRVLSAATASARALARGLVPGNVKFGGLGVALEDIAERCRRVHGLTCEFSNTCNIDHAITAPAAEHLYRIAQEATTNVARHAGATRVALSLATRGTDLVLRIVDDGRGFDSTRSHANGGVGLKTMEYRAHVLGGELRVTSGAGGTQLECVVPIATLTATAASPAEAQRP